MARKQPQNAKPLSKDEVFVLAMTRDRPVSWAQIYCKAVDTLLKKGFIAWRNKDERGAFYSTIIATYQGIEAYEIATKSKDRV
jgi:hypothetical protein